DAKRLLKEIQDKNVEYDPERKLSIVVEFVAGKVTETIERMIALYRPDALVVGTRGQGGIRTWGAALTGGVGSVSKYCLSRSPVPVIVVRPERKVRKTTEKRRADPKRRTHFDECVFIVSAITRPNTHNTSRPTGSRDSIRRCQCLPSRSACRSRLRCRKANACPTLTRRNASPT
ncbi:hypothetical protein EXIGLDRAFT_790488, partial [Exidia glandulosa HHB12029]